MALPLTLLSIRGSQSGWLRFDRELLLIAWLFPFIDLTFSKVLAIKMFFLISASLAIVVMMHLRKRPEAAP